MANPESKFVITAEDRATATLKRVSTEFGGLGRAALSAASTLTAFGGALSLGALVAQVKSVADLQDRFGKLAQQTGIGVTALTELDYAAKLSDVSTEDLSTAVTRLTSKMGDVAQGSKEAAAVFDSLGVKVKNNDGTLRSSEEVLKDIAQRFSEFADGSTKTAYAVEIFGRSGAKLIPMLNSGRDGLAEMADEARALGVVFDEKAAKAAERFNDNLTRLGQAAQGLKIELLQGLIPPLYEITQRFIEARAAGIDFIDALDIAANIKGFGTLDEKIASVRRDLKGLESGKLPRFFSLETAAEATARLNAELKNLLALQRRVENRETAQHPAGFSTALLGRGGTVGAEPPRLRGPAAAGARDSDFDKYLRQLDEQIAKTAELTTYERLLYDVESGRLKGLTDKQLEALRAKAEAVDAAQNAAEAAKREGEFQELLNQAKQREIDANDKLIAQMEDRANKWLDELDPMREFIRHIEDVDRVVAELQKRGWIFTPEQIAAMKELGNGLDANVEAVDKTKDAARELGLTFQSAFEDAIIGGKSLQDVLSAIGQDIARIFIRKSITEPFANWFAGLNLFGGLFGIPSHADGLDRVPYDGYIAKLHAGERVLTAAEARGDRGKSLSISQSFIFQGNASRAEGYALAQRVKAETIAALREAGYRNDQAVTG